VHHLNPTSVRTATNQAVAFQIRHLQNLTPVFDLIQAMVRRVDGTVLYCTSGMCHLYGWSQDEMLGRCSHQLLATEFPKPLREIDNDLLRYRQWTGELKHRRRDGTVLWVASHWALRYDDDTGEPIVSEVNNDITELKRIQEELRNSQLLLTESRDHQRALSDRLLTAQDDERRRIAQDLHDDLCQKLAILAFDARNLTIRSGQSDLARGLGSLYERIVGISEGVRKVAYRLHPSAVDDLGIVSALQTLCDEFSQGNSSIRFRLCGPAEVVSPAQASCLYRVLQEALVNVAKHSRAKNVAVNLSIDAGAGRVRLTIKDSGVGFSVARVKGGLGLLNMQERVSRVDGRFSIRTKPGEGTRLTIELPLKVDATNTAAVEASRELTETNEITQNENWRGFRSQRL
jgi:PAS domain S-box-containing protein